MNLEELARQAGYSVSPMCGIAFPQHGAEDETELLARFAALVLEDAATRCDQVAAHTIDMDPKQVAAYLAAAIRAMKPAATAQQELDDTTEDLYDRLHSLSKSLESSGRLDDMRAPAAQTD